MLKKYEVKLILLAIPSASSSKRKKILGKLSSFPVEVKILPSVDNIVNGEVTIDSIKHVEVNDILGRETVKPKSSLLIRNIKDKNILITGAGGSIGSELSRRFMQERFRQYLHGEQGGTVDVLFAMFQIYLNKKGQCY